MKINTIKIKDFKPFGNVQVDLTKYNNNILVTAHNEDSLGADSNGGGKSSFCEVILSNIFGTFPGMVSADSIIRKGQDQCETDIHYSNGMQIKRFRGKKKDLQLFIDGEEKKYKTDTFTQEEIFRQFGLNIIPKIALNDFYNRCYFSPFVLKSFASPGATSQDRINLIMRFLKLDQVEKCVPIFKDRKSEFKRQLVDVPEGNIEEINNKLEQENDRVSELSGRIEGLNEEKNKYAKKMEDLEKAKELKYEIENLNVQGNIKTQNYNQNRDYMRGVYTKLVNELEQVGELEEDLKIQEAKIDEVIVGGLETNRKKFDDQMKTVDFGIGELKLTKGTLKKEIESLESAFEESQECPYCSGELMVDFNKIVKHDNAKIKINLHIKNEELELIDIKISTLIEDQNNVNVKLGKVNEKLADIQGIKSGISNLKFQISEIEKKKVEKDNLNKKGKAAKVEFENVKLKLNQDILEKKSKLKLLVVDESIKDKVVGINEDILEFTGYLNVSETMVKNYIEKLKEIDDIKEDNKKLELKIVREDQAIDLVQRGIKASINQFLPVFANTVQKYLDIFGAGLQFCPEIDPESIRDSFKLYIEEDSVKYLIDERSRGEQTRIAISVGFSLIELSGDSLGFLIADEVVDSLDATGMDLFFEILNSDELRDVQKLIISHDSNLKTYFESVITVVKEGGVASIN